MKRSFFIAIALLTLIAGKVGATGQTPELVVIGRDTLPILQLPLDGIDDGMRSRLMDNLRPEGADPSLPIFPISSSLWRGYRGIWQIADGKLYLTGLDNVDNGDEVLQKTFGEHYHNGRVLAWWFSSQIIVPRGDVLRWDGVFARTYDTEDFYYFEGGVETKMERVENYVRVPGGLSRRQDPFRMDPYPPVAEAAAKVLKGKILSTCEGDYRVTIGANGRISKVEYARSGGNPKCPKKLKRKLKKLKFDIVKWNGKPYEETVPLNL